MAARRNISPGEDAVFLEMIRGGKTYRDVSLLRGVAVATVVTGVRRAKARQKAEAVERALREMDERKRIEWNVRDAAKWGEAAPPQLEPLFPVGFFTPKSKCPHKGPIPSGSHMVCMVCHKSGMDGVRSLPINPPPPPDPPTTKPPEPAERHAEAA